MPSKAKRSESHFLLREWVVFWLLVLCDVALVAAIFGNVDVRTLFSEQHQQIIQHVIRVPITSPSQQAPSESKGRLSLEGYTTKDCQMDWNFDQTSIWIKIEDSDLGVRFELPYNPSWGNAKYIAPLYEKDTYSGNTYRFGPVSPGGACGVGADSTLMLEKPRSAENVLKDLRAIEYPGITSPIETTTVNGMTVYSYITGELGGGPTYTIIGKKYLYTLASNGWLGNDDAMHIIGSIQQFTPKK